MKNITRGGPLFGAWYNGGNLSLMVKELTGVQPDYYISDLRNAGEEKIVRAEDAMRQDMRATIFNRSWIEGMMKEGYAGAQQMAGGVFSTMGWEINREGSVSAEAWQEVVNVYLRDSKNLKIRDWFNNKNPYAFQGITQNLLEAARKEYWNPDAATRLEIATAYAQNVVQYGHREPGELNHKLETFLENTFSAPAPGSKAAEAAKKLLEQYRQKTVQEMAAPKSGAAAQSSGSAGGSSPNAAGAKAKPEITDTASPAATNQTQQVTGNKMVKTEQPNPLEKRRILDYWPFVLIGCLAVIFLIGFWKKIGFTQL
jgi:cobaltochelatase CobN